MEGELRSPVSFKHDEVSLFIIFENRLKELNSGAGMSQHIITPKEIPLAFQTAWNKHDMQAFAALLIKMRLSLTVSVTTLKELMKLLQCINLFMKPFIVIQH